MVLFVGTLCASFLLVPAFALRVGARTRLPPRPGIAVAWGAAAAVIGVLMLETDRRAMVGLHSGAHVWLEVVGLLCVDAGLVTGLSLLFERTSRLGRRVDARPRWAWAPCVVYMGAVATFARPGPLRNLDVRVPLADSPLAELIIDLHPFHHPGALLTGKNTDHAALAYPRRHERTQDLGFNIILVTVDALRGDVLDDATNLPPDSELLRLARESTNFTRAYAPGTRTALSMSAVLSGRYSANLDWELWVAKAGTPLYPRTEDEGELPPGYGHTTYAKDIKGGGLAERLRSRGLATLAIPYGGKTTYFKEGVGFERGFDDYVTPRPGRYGLPSSGKVVRAALGKLDRVRKESDRFFLWVHLFDPHSAHRDWDRYLDLVGSVDAAVGQLRRALDRRKLSNNTILVLLADHGEAFQEHGSRGHASSLFDEQARVPFIIHVPGATPQTVAVPVSTVDATPTILAMAGATLDGLDGVNLAPVVLGEAEPIERPVFIELHRYLSGSGQRTADIKGVVLGCYKLIYNRRLDELRLFDLCEDPKELENLAAELPEITRELFEILAAFVTRGEQAHPLP